MDTLNQPCWLIETEKGYPPYQSLLLPILAISVGYKFQKFLKSCMATESTPSQQSNKRVHANVL